MMKFYSQFSRQAKLYPKLIQDDLKTVSASYVELIKSENASMTHPSVTPSISE
jgi:hypothetical protein